MTELPIIVIDDDIIHLTLINRLLQRFHGLSIEEVKGGQLGLSRLYSLRDSQTPAIVLIDLNMPDIDGYQLLDFVAHEPAFQHIYIIIVSTSDEPEDITYAKQLGFTDYLVKPLNHEHLIEKINSINKHYGTPREIVFKTPDNMKLFNDSNIV